MWKKAVRTLRSDSKEEKDKEKVNNCGKVNLS